MLKNDVKIWKDNLPKDDDLYAVKFLYKKIKQYVMGTVHRSDNKLKAKADIYRHLIRHVQQVLGYIDDLEKELIEEKVNVIFPKNKEHVFCKKDQIYIKSNLSDKDWTRAFEEEKEKK